MSNNSSLAESRQRIEGKFYPLDNSEWVRACNELTPAQRDVLYFLRTIDPFGSRNLDLSISEIGRKLGIDKSTVSRALKALDEKGWIDLELVRVKVKIKSHGCCSDATVLPPRNPGCTSATQDAPAQPRMHQRNNEGSEPLPAKSSTPSKILLDILKTLSEAERENFEKFVKETWKQTTGKEVGSIRAFLSDPQYQREWLEKWQTSTVGKKSADDKAAVDWPNDPRFDEWLNKAYDIGVPWLNERPEETEERSRFLKWCIVGKGFELYAGRLENAS